MPFRLEIRRLRLPVHLGVTEAERAVPQDVEIDVSVRFSTEPRACLSDKLEDAFCYATGCAVLRKIARSRPFALIESLACESHLALSALPHGRDAQISVTVHKIHPPIESLQGGTAFTYGDA